MTYKDFEFKANLLGIERELAISVPLENDGVLTSKFCPQELLSGGINFIPAINGESESEFVADCRNQLEAMEKPDSTNSLMEVHIAGLLDSVMKHLAQCGRLIFGDLLIYMDIFSLLLEADGFEEDEIRVAYPKILREIIELFPDFILNTFDLSSFKGSHFDTMLSIVIEKQKEKMEPAGKKFSNIYLFDDPGINHQRTNKKH